MKFLTENDTKNYVSPTLSIMEFLSEDVIRTSDFKVGDEDFDVPGDAVPFD